MKNSMKTMGQLSVVLLICVLLGQVCFGVDEDGNTGTHFGLSSCKE